MTYYQYLGVEPKATQEEIKIVYKSLILISHPDKVPHQQAQFLAIQEAYEVLSDPERRKTYDEQLARGLDTLDNLEPNIPINRPYRLLANPHALNHYEFTNHLFKVTSDHTEYLIPGQAISSWDKSRLWHQLHAVAHELNVKRKQLTQNPKRTKKEQVRVDLLFNNEDKIGQITSILTTDGQAKLLYDLALGSEVVPFTDEMKEMEQLIGGRERLATYVKTYPDIPGDLAIFSLREAGCLNPANFAHLMTCQSHFEFSDISFVTNELLEAKLLDQPNFERIMAHKTTIGTLFKGMLDLKMAGLLDQESFEELVHHGNNAETVGSTWRWLHEDNLLNETNRQMIVKLAEKGININRLIVDSLIRLEEEKGFTPKDGLILQWTGKGEDLQALCLRIDEMFAYGIFLLSSDADKAQTVFLLALELKKSLKTFFEKPLEEQVRSQIQFKREFRQLLRSQNGAMEEHRAYWKVIVANIAIALTGVGLFALGAHYLYSGQCFFAQTQREQLRDAIEQSPWVQEGLVL
ncbi:MAG: J domain-containing protein [Sphingobacteriaceae bacterium]|nr:J domain-containing protein [Sphingobacteriaceae bacterium]